MSPRKKTAKSPKSPKSPKSSTRDSAKANKQQPTSRIARIPALIRYVFVLLISLYLSSGLFTLTSETTLNKLDPLSRNIEDWEVGGLVAWKGIELGLAWIIGLNALETITFTFLTHIPVFTLLTSFYKVKPSTALASYAIILFSIALPFALLRKAKVNDNSQTKPTASILTDPPTTIYTTLAAASIFSLVLYISYATWLPAQLAAHFSNIRDISATHAGAAGWPILFTCLIPAGWAARNFLFAAWARAAVTIDEAGQKGKEDTDRDGEYLFCVLYRKTWGALAACTRVLIVRTVVLVLMTLANTVVQLVGTVQGVSVEGAIAWGAVWAVAGLLVGVVFGWIGGGYAVA